MIGGSSTKERVEWMSQPKSRADRRWGAADEVGRLRSVLVRAPRDEWAVVRADAWNDAAGALVDPGGMWYWESRTPPDLALVREQHGGLVAALEAEGVEVVA